MRTASKGDKLAHVGPKDKTWNNLVKEWKRLAQKNDFTTVRSASALYQQHFKLRRIAQEKDDEIIKILFTKLTRALLWAPGARQGA